MSTKALRKELLAAIAMVIVAAIALSGSTYAWFAINNTVTATGMEVKTVVQNNLFITSDTLNSTATITNDSLYKSSFVNKSLVKVLEPVSTVNGQSYFYTKTNNVESSGDAVQDQYVAYDLTAVDDKGTYANNFENNYQAAGAEGYVDYVFQLKAINSKDTVAKIALTKLDLTYGGTTDDSKAYRVAMFVENLTTVNNKTNVTTTTNPTGDFTGVDKSVIYIPSGATNFNDGKAVSSTTTLGAVTYNDAAANSVWEVAANTTAYYKVVVRLWLEGEDSTCNNATFAKLNDQWALDLEFKLDDDPTGVVNVGLAATAVKIDVATDSPSGETVVINNAMGQDVTYRKLTTNSDYYIDTETITSATHVYKIEQGRPIDVTNQCILPN